MHAISNLRITTAVTIRINCKQQQTIHIPTVHIQSVSVTSVSSWLLLSFRSSLELSVGPVEVRQTTPNSC